VQTVEEWAGPELPDQEGEDRDSTDDSKHAMEAGFEARWRSHLNHRGAGGFEARR
jgi:hypothetical protein